MLILRSLILCLALGATAAPGQAQVQASRTGTNLLSVGKPPRPCLGCDWGPPLTNGPLLNGVAPQASSSTTRPAGGGNVVCSRFSGNCWINNGTALNSGRTPGLGKTSSQGRSGSTQSQLEQRLDPTAVRLADGTIIPTR